MRKMLIIMMLSVCAAGQGICGEPMGAAEPERGQSAHYWDGRRNEIRIGWADFFFESAMQYEFTKIGKTNARTDYLTGHFFGEYQYHWLNWLSSGMQVDFFQAGWHDRRELATDAKAAGHNYYNLSLLPTVRFTWFRSEYVDLYSSVMAGLCVNSGTERDEMTGERTLCYPAFGLTMAGCEVGKNGWYGSVEWGGLNALRDIYTIVMASSRIVSVSVGYKFDTKKNNHVISK